MKGCKKTEEIEDFDVGEVYNINYSEMLQKPRKNRFDILIRMEKYSYKRNFQLINVSLKDGNVDCFFKAAGDEIGKAHGGERMYEKANVERPGLLHQAMPAPKNCLQIFM